LTLGLWLLAAVLVVAIAAVLLLKAWPLLHPAVTERAALDPSCDLLLQPCSLPFASGGEVRLAISPRGIPSVHPLEIEVRVAGLPPPQRVEVDFRGVEMAMGFNRASLERQDSAASDPDSSAGFKAGEPSGEQAGEQAGEPVGVGGGSTWTGAGMLPVCVRDRMTWEAQVLLYYPGRLLSAPFRFVSRR
jgi:hypothetical protein